MLAWGVGVQCMVKGNVKIGDKYSFLLESLSRNYTHFRAITPREGGEGRREVSGGGGQCLRL